MDYKNTLINYLFSENNIQHLTDMIMKNLTINKSSMGKCKKIIISTMTKYINNLDILPQTENDYVELISIINRQCYEDFSIYLANKFPTKNIYKNNSALMHTEQKQNQNQNSTIQSTNSNLIILTEDEKNKLLEQNGMNVRTPEMSSDLFLEYLTNPSVLQMFQLMINKINQFNPQSSINDHIKVDMVMTEDEVYEILKNSSEKYPEKKIKKQSNKKEKTITEKQINKPKILNIDKKSHIINQNILIQNKSDEQNESDGSAESNESDQSDQSDQSNQSNESNESNESDQSDELDELIEENNSTESSNSDSSDNGLDLSKGITGEKLLKIEKRIKDIVALKTSYLNKRNNSNSANIDKKMDKLDEEKNNLIASLIKCRNNSDKSAKENKNKINTLSQSNRPIDPDINAEYLDLKLDPSKDYNDSKNIIIKIKSEDKISEILLVDYYVPFNANNVNRFNNIFAIYMNDRAYRINIPPSKYSIQPLLNYIKSQINFLDFNIDSSTNIITITNNMNTKFDLMLGDDTIFPMLGFNHKSNTYKDKMAYSGSTKYNSECNEKIFFGLSGTSSMEPILLEFDKKVTLNTVLKKNRSGFNLKQLNLRFTNSVDQFYDFIMPINICLKLTFVNKS